MKFNRVKLIVFFSLLFLIVVSLLFYLFFEEKYKNKVYPGVYFKDSDLSGLSEIELRDLISAEVYKFDLEGVSIIHGNEIFSWRRDSSSFDPDLSFQSVFFDIDSLVSKAFSFGRSGYFLDDLKFKIGSFYEKSLVEMPFAINRGKVLDQLGAVFGDINTPSKDAKLKSSHHDGQIEFSVIAEEYGRLLDKDSFFSQFEENLKRLNSKSIHLEFVESLPLLKSEDIVSMKDEARELLSLAPFYLKYEEGEFVVGQELFSTWLKVERYNEDELGFSLDYDNMIIFFEEEIIEKVNKEKIEPQFEFEDNRVSVFFPGQDGLVLDYEKSFYNILNFFLMKEMDDVHLEFSVQEVGKVDSINDLGIKEIIGVGKSSFAGSSNNRIHNIRVGTDKFTGLIIAPGEEFSFNSNLGPVNEKTGYRTELVIKGDKTVPEYGGGLCQVSTTIFRAALGTGLPITARSNHSYRVSYYEPAGTDATIYNPSPDLRFVNDTGHNILIQSEIKDGELFFYFWGTSDGRIVEVSDSVIYNIVRPGPTRLIETTDLRPGEKKCTERAINGADTYFDYEVVYNPGTEDENIVKKRIHSKYVPWTEVCLVGAEEKKEEEE